MDLKQHKKKKITSHGLSYMEALDYLAIQIRLYAFKLSYFLCRLLFFFQINFSNNSLYGQPPEYQTVWDQIRPDGLSDKICLQRLSADDTSMNGLKQF